MIPRPSNAKTVSIVALFVSLILATDYGLAPIPNVKLVDTLVFACAFVFGFRMGAYVALASELIWGVISPYGFGQYIIPFLAVGELLYAFAGWGASRIWNGEEISTLSPRNTYFGALLCICAFIWDTETNLATGLLQLIAQGHITLSGLMLFEGTGLIFMIPHEITDLVFGSLLAPIVILYFTRRLRGGALTISSKQEEKETVVSRISSEEGEGRVNDNTDPSRSIEL
ncbi:MAG TPA: hypothetical protein VFF30_01535 [Nitrososphaerales archaeon]|nr:hypothetical protein [Nitrososphaerales archaeon]